MPNFSNFFLLKSFPTRGFGSTFQSPVCKILPNFVLIAMALGSGMECVVEIISIAKGPNLNELSRGIVFIKFSLIFNSLIFFF